jgi:hypothetical protein
MMVVGLIVRIVGCALRIMLPVGALLIIVGLVWHLMGG